MADAKTGAVIRKVVSTAPDPHFDSLQYIGSAGAWDPSGRRFAMAALSQGNPVLVIVDTTGQGQHTEIPLEDLGEIYNPSWSPDGARIVFSALKGGLSDLFIFTLPTRALQQLTADAFADLHPAWSPDGESIEFATDRFTTRSTIFRGAAVGLLDSRPAVIRPLHPSLHAKQMSPQWSPSGTRCTSSRRDGFSNVTGRYRVGELRRSPQWLAAQRHHRDESALAVASRQGAHSLCIATDVTTRTLMNRGTRRARREVETSLMTPCCKTRGRLRNARRLLADLTRACPHLRLTRSHAIAQLGIDRRRVHRRRHGRRV